MALQPAASRCPCPPVADGTELRPHQIEVGSGSFFSASSLFAHAAHPRSCHARARTSARGTQMTGSNQLAGGELAGHARMGPRLPRRCGSRAPDVASDPVDHCRSRRWKRDWLPYAGDGGGGRCLRGLVSAGRHGSHNAWRCDHAAFARHCHRNCTVDCEHAWRPIQSLAFQRLLCTVVVDVGRFLSSRRER